MKFKPIEQWALRQTKLRSASHVEPVVPHPVAIVIDVARRECLPRRPWGSSCGTARCAAARGMYTNSSLLSAM
eukprot:900070-Pyramimonas_sp.AAC.1